MKKTTSFIAIVLCLFVSLSFISGCGKTPKDSASDSSDSSLENGSDGGQDDGQGGESADQGLSGSDASDVAVGGSAAGETSKGNGGASVPETAKYTIKATGSKYADGIYLPPLTKKQAAITYMTNTDWDFIQKESTDLSPTPVYHAMMVWKEVYGVDVKIEMVDWDSFTNHLITSVTSGEGPDVFRYAVHPRWANSNLVAALDDKLDLTDPDYGMEHMREYAVDGKIYGIYSQPTAMPNRVVMYNKTKFEEAGEKTPLAHYTSGTWNFTQFVKTAKNLTSAAGDEYGFSGTGLYPTGFPWMILNPNRSVTSMINDPNYQKWLSARIDLYQTQKAARPSDKQMDNFRTTFPAGKDAMLITNGKEYGQIMDDVKRIGSKSAFGLAPIPAEDMIGETLPRGQNASYADGFATSSKSVNQTGALEFLRLVTKIGTRIGKSQGEFGALTNYMTDEEKQVFRAIKYQDTAYLKGGTLLDSTGIAGLDNLRNTYLLPLYRSTSTKTVPAAISELNGPLNALIKEYEISVGLKR
ncbi:MAG: extracellular solute-binding protein [Oscillospiraceae bacterium]|nr:extracellular solute-binding protein [Oscillospiraceae bacterium]